MGEKNGLFTYWEGNVTIHGAALAPIVEIIFWGFGGKDWLHGGHAAAKGKMVCMFLPGDAAGFSTDFFHVFITPVSTTNMYPFICLTTSLSKTFIYWVSCYAGQAEQLEIDRARTTNISCEHNKRARMASSCFCQGHSPPLFLSPELTPHHLTTSPPYSARTTTRVIWRVAE